MALDLKAEKVSTDSGSQSTSDRLAPQRMLHQIDKASKRWQIRQHVQILSATRMPPQGVFVRTASNESDVDAPLENPNSLQQLAYFLHNWDVFQPESAGTIIRFSLHASATSLSDIRSVLRSRERDERLNRMSPERKALYEDIMKLRQEIGPVDIDVSEVLREIRDE